jgi:hypothetical protein
MTVLLLFFAGACPVRRTDFYESWMVCRYTAKGKKGFQGKETAGFVPLGSDRDVPDRCKSSFPRTCNGILANSMCHESDYQ